VPIVRFAAPAARIAAAVAAAALALAGCAAVVEGHPSAALAPDAQLSVVGDSHSQFDVTAKNALADVMAFWQQRYPSISGGRSLPKLKGGLYSIDGQEVVTSGKVAGPAGKEGCVELRPTFIVDNAAYCRVDDSIVWDRNPQHLIGVLADRYGPLLMAMAFAHEFGHALQYRLGTFALDLPVIDVESQADCAAGAFLGEVIAGRTAHFRATPQQLDQALLGYLQVRDPTPVSGAGISHGDGFDRLSAIDDGILHGATFCYRDSYFDRKFTERPFVTDQDYLSGGNEPFDQLLDPNDPKTDPNAGGLQPDLNRFWTAAAKSINETFTPVKIAEAAHPRCGAAPTSQFGYCPDDNTVYYSRDFAKRAYYSLTVPDISETTAKVTLQDNQPADFALGTLFAVGWGMAVRHQLFHQPITGTDALLAAACYVGAYSKDINIEPSSNSPQFVLSPPDLDEATEAMLTLVGSDQAYGARGTTGLQRIQSFVKGYNGGLSSC
jgi:predicted metalloprotease